MLTAMMQLGDYVLIHRLGVGGMGEVWRARREALGGAARDVAIKVLSPSRVDDALARKMFIDEARLSMSLCNSNIVQVYDVAETDDKTCYMVMELVDGMNLNELQAKLLEADEALPDAVIAYIIGEVLKGLVHAHELRDADQSKTVVHRDISPHNVMVSVSGEVKLMDFGIARFASEETSGLHVKGKIRYMPPEQLRGETREPTLDLFAVGATLHELLDRSKFRGSKIDEARMYGMVIDGEVPPLQRAADTIPPELEQLRSQLLAAKPEDRIQTAREAFRCLSGWSGYRDTRFELEEIVRRFAPPRAEQVAARSVTRHTAVDHAVLAGSGSDALTHIDAGSRVVAKGGSDTDLEEAASSHALVYGPPVSRAAHYVGALALVIVLAGIGAGVLLASKDPAASVRVAPVRDEPSPVLVIESAAPEPEPEPELEPELEPEPEPKPDPEPELVLDEADLQGPDDEPPPERTVAPAADPKPRLIKVTLQLGRGVTWAEVEIADHKLEVDAFERKRASVRLPEGTHEMACRTQINSPLQPADEIEVSGRALKLRVNGGCSITRD